MGKSKDELMEMEVPTDEDENVGDEPKKKHVVKRKSKEERAKDRKIVFVTLIMILLATMLFWLMPKVRNKNIVLPSLPVGREKTPETETSKNKQSGKYIEYSL